MRNLHLKEHLTSWNARWAFCSQNQEDLFLPSYFGRKSKGFLLDIAAADGITFSNSFKLINELDWGGILVEPCPVHKSNLDILYSDVPEVKVFNGAIHQTLTEVEFNEVEFQEIGLSNITGGHPAASRYQHKTYTVPAIDINSLLKQYNAPTTIDFVSLDIEGAEGEVVNYWDFEKYTVNLWCIEEGGKFEPLLNSKGYQRFTVSNFKVDDALYRKI
jgi:FkbM family methyltransferase